MDHLAIDTQMVYQQGHLLMLTDDPGLQSQVSKFHQPSSTSHQKWMARESLWIRLPPWIISLYQKLPFRVAEHCYSCWPLVEEHSDLHQPREVGAPRWVQHQTRVICWWLTFSAWAMMVQWPRPDVTGLEVKCMQWQYPHGSFSLEVEHL